MSTTATLHYKAVQAGSSLIALQTVMAAVPVPTAVLNALGVRVTSDSTALGPPVQRTIVLNLGPSATATATASFVPGDESGSPIESVTVTGAGANYVLPPNVSFTGGGDGITEQAHAVAFLKIATAAVASAGAGYSANTFATVVGQQSPSNPNAVQAKLTLTIIGGHITAVAIATAGDGYVGIPEVLIVDPTGTGSGASVSLTMSVSSITVTNPGSGYDPALSPVTVVLTPAFATMFPPTSDQSTPFKQLMTVPLSQAILSPVEADPPVMA